MCRAAAGVRGMKVAATDALIEGCVVGKEDKYIFTITENGLGKISSLDEYREQGRGGSGIKVSAMTKKTGAVIAAFTLTEEQKNTQSIILISRTGQTIRVPLADVRITGRTPQGVILAKIRNSDDNFVSATLVEASDERDEEGSDITTGE